MGVPRINLAETSDFDLGGLRVSPARRQVCMAGECRELEPKVAQVLIALASASPAVVSRDKLVEQCWDGRIVGDDALNRCVLALRHLAKEFSPEPFAIETVPRVGYSLLAGPNDSSSKGHRRIHTRVAIALLLTVVVAIGLAFSWLRYERAEAAPASIAVLPFRNLSTGDAYFAEGVSEEILDQLSREPQFRVAGRASSGLFGKDPEVRDVARRLKVDYVLEGSVRTQGNRVRVSAGLIRASDRVRLWSDSFDGTLNDIFAIQSAIGQGVASGLRRQLVHSPDTPRRVNGEAYALYLNARGLLRSRNPQEGQDGIALLKGAIKLDPAFAPAWSSLAEAMLLDGRTKGDEGLIAVMPQAGNAARRALQLNPNLGDAHAVLAELLGRDSPEGIAHLQRAAALAPRSSQGMLWRGMAFSASGKFAETSAAYNQAHDLDPIWSSPLRFIVDNTARLGDRRGAESVIKRGFPDDVSIQKFALARVASTSGDFSEAASGWSALAIGQSQWASPSKLSLEDLLFALNLSKDRPSRPPLPTIGEGRAKGARVWMTAPPSPSEWQRRNRSSAAELVYRDENVIAAKLMLGAGRASELAATYDSPTGLLGVRRGQRVGTCFLQSAAVIAVALRAVGRHVEADAILRQADAAIQAAYRRGQVPLWFEDDAAGIWALQGKSGQAVDALERALRRGSSHSTRTDLPQLKDEPALRSLRGYPPFEAVRAKYEAHYARERRETARALKMQI
jgi:TolB-like protein/DNA-binding winged helix-turn-helix (wHTH) protein/Flp pilus assembly protein TadD